MRCSCARVWREGRLLIDCVVKVVIVMRWNETRTALLPFASS